MTHSIPSPSHSPHTSPYFPSPPLDHHRRTITLHFIRKPLKPCLLLFTPAPPIAPLVAPCALPLLVWLSMTHYCLPPSPAPLQLMNTLTHGRLPSTLFACEKRAPCSPYPALLYIEDGMSVCRLNTSLGFPTVS